MNVQGRQIEVQDTAKVQAELWNMRYNDDGILWGQNPSETVVLLKEALASLSDGVYRARDIITVGAGYGRDEIFLAASGANITAFEVASNGVKLGKKLAKKNNVANRINWKEEDFSKTRSRKVHDALLSHRTLHLLDDEQVDGFVKKAATSVKEGGLVAISARNFSDFNPDQMRWLSEDNGIAEYTLPERDGHIVRFWNEARFRKHFGNDFEIELFKSGGELESEGNNIRTKFTLMLAYKKVTSQTNTAVERRSSLEAGRRAINVGVTAARMVTAAGNSPITVSAFNKP